MKLSLSVHYKDDYPDSIPELSLESISGDVSETEFEGLLRDLQAVGEENLGMAMTFTLVSHLREKLSTLIRAREDTRKRVEAEKERLALEEEEARTRGTPVTVESFKAWKVAFDRENAERKAREEEEIIKGMTPKERDEWKKQGSRLSGRQLFEKGGKIVEEDSLLEEGAVSVDASQYEREHVEEEEEGITFSDSD